MSAANDYNDQDVIAGILNPYIEEKGLKRSDFFITTKVPAGFGGAAACKAVRCRVCGRVGVLCHIVLTALRARV